MASRRAFTLVEMLTAVAIIAVLALFTVTGMGTLTRQAQNTICESNLRQIYLVLNAYALDHCGEYPAIRDIGPPQVYWYMALASYAGGKNKAGQNYGDSRDVASIFRCPGAKADFLAPSDSVIFRSYVASDLMRTGKTGWDKPIRGAMVPNPSRSLICVDGAKTTSGTDYACDSGNIFNNVKFSYRHGGGNTAHANGLFFDGHVEPLKSGSITREMWDKP